MPSASAAPICASTAWRGLAAISSSAAPARCGTPTARPRRFRPAAVAAALLRPDPILSGLRPRSCCDFRDGFLEGKREVEIAPATFRLKDYLAFLAANAESIAAFKARQQAAFDAERARWQESGQDGAGELPMEPGRRSKSMARAAASARRRWRARCRAASGRCSSSRAAQVSAGETLIIVESMKMEIAVSAPSSGIVHEVRCAEGRPVQLGQALVIMAEPGA